MSFSTARRQVFAALLGAERNPWEATMAATQSTYRAVQAVSPGKLELANLPVVDPPAGHVRVRVEACSFCHSDSATVEGISPIRWPRVPGQEAVGRIDVVGQGVEGWANGPASPS
jgi:propanol-preferring alcohol dehydrogenase